MRFALSLLLAAAGTYHAVDAFVPRTTLLVPTERIGTNSQLAVSTGSLPEIGINKLESIDSSALSSLLLGEENSTDRLVREFTEWAQPQVEALADYVVADLSKYWDSYLAALEAKDTGAIVGTGWGGIIFVLITANTIARGSSEERRLAKFEAEQAAKQAAAEAAAAKAKKSGLFGAKKGLQMKGLQMRREKAAASAARKKELEQKKFAAALQKRAKENKAAFSKKQQEKKKKEAQRRRVLTTDFQKRKGLGKFGKK